jgi:Flp pilus assembly pilin Flp
MIGVRMMDRFRRDESGVAMVVAVVLLAVMGTLMALVMTVSTHTNTSTARGRSWVQALHVGEAGVQKAIAKLQETQGSYAGTLNGATDVGTYSTTVTHLARNRIRIESVGHAGAGAGLGASRRVRVTMAPPGSFDYALYSQTSIQTKNNDTITGDIWANQNVIVDAGDTVDGTVYAATGYVSAQQNSHITGDVWSGGFDPATARAVFLGNNATIDGDVKASVTAPTDPVTCGGENAANYKVQLDNGSHVGGSVTTWGSKTGSGTVGGSVTQNTCTAAPPTQPMPTFTYSAANYDAATLHEYGTPGSPSATARSDFQAYVAAHKSAFHGTFYVNQLGSVSQNNRLDLSDVVIDGDTTIVSNTPIYTDRTTDNTTDAILTLVSTYQPPTGSSCETNKDNSECAIHLKNHFATSGYTATLIFAPYGPVAVKNNQVQYGAIYADAIEIKNNQSLIYDSRIQNVVGFGGVTYEVLSWIELAP